LCFKPCGSCDGLVLNEATEVYFNGYAFLVLNREDGTGRCWGFYQWGGYCDGVDFSGVEEVFVTQTAFLAVDDPASTYGRMGRCWGNLAGADCGADPPFSLSGVTRMYAGEDAFVVMNAQAGVGQCWGDSSYGGACPTINFTKPGCAVSGGSGANAAYPCACSGALCRDGAWCRGGIGFCQESCTVPDGSGVSDVYPRTCGHTSCLDRERCVEDAGDGLCVGACSVQEGAGASLVYPCTCGGATCAGG